MKKGFRIYALSRRQFLKGVRVSTILDEKELFPSNIRAITNVNSQGKEDFISELVEEVKEYYKQVYYINYSQLDVESSKHLEVEKLGIKNNKVLQDDEKVNKQIDTLKDKYLLGKIEKEQQDNTDNKEYYTKEELIKHYTQLKNKKGKVYIQTVVQIIKKLALVKGKTIFIYNEPELYLGVEQQQKLMKTLHKIVDNTDHVILMLTDSSNILQNITSGYVYERTNKGIERIERENTFGGNLTTVERNVLNNNVKETYYYNKVQEKIDTNELNKKSIGKELGLGRDAELYMRLILHKNNR